MTLNIKVNGGYKMSDQNVYQRNGYESRKHYLQCMSDDYNVPLETVYSLASMLGSVEDFDGLVSALEDAEEIDWE
jgi:hypothetical protein